MYWQSSEKSPFQLVVPVSVTPTKFDIVFTEQQNFLVVRRLSSSIINIQPISKSILNAVSYLLSWFLPSVADTTAPPFTRIPSPEPPAPITTFKSLSWLIIQFDSNNKKSLKEIKIRGKNCILDDSVFFMVAV